MESVQLFRLGVLPALDGLHDLLFVVQSQDHGAQHTEDDGGDGDHAQTQRGGGDLVGVGVLGGADDGQGGEDQHGQGLAPLHGEGAGGKEHALPVLAGDDAVGLGHVCHDGLGDDAQQRHGEGRDDADQHAGKHAGQERDDADQGGDEIGQGQPQEAEDDHLLLAVAADEAVDEGIEAGGEHGHAAHEDHGHALIQLHGDLDEEGQAGLEQGQADPVHDVGGGEDPELPVFEGGGQGLEDGGIGGLGVHEFLFLQQEGGQQHAHAGDDGQHDEADAVAPVEAHGPAQHAGEDEGGVGQHGAGEEGQGDGGGDEHPVLLGLAELGDQSVVGGAVHGHEQVEQHHEHGDPDHVGAADGVDRSAEQQDRHDGQGNRSILHIGDAAAAGVFAAVGEIGDQRVGDGVEHTAQGGDQTQDRQEAQNHKTRLDELDGPLLNISLRGEIEGDEPCTDDAAQDGPAQLANGEDDHLLLGQSLHGTAKYYV